MRILIVENDAIIGMSLADELAKIGHVVIGPVASAGAAFLLAKSMRVTLAIIDLEPAAFQEHAALARKLKANLGVQSLLLSSEPERAMQDFDLAMGVLAKPFDFADIASVVAVAAEVLAGGSPPPPIVPWALTLFRRPRGSSSSAIP
jgi:AmiR/NasT family two-component response regulator